MELTAGKLIPACFTPDISVLQRLESIISKKQFKNEFIDRIADRRMQKEEFELIFKRELLELYKWGIKRVVLHSIAHLKKKKDFYKKVYVFLPEHATAIHLLRRAIPFACLGIPVHCYFKQTVVQSEYIVAARLIQWLNLEERVRVNKQNPVKILSKIDNIKNLIVITGKTQSVSAVRSRIKNACIIGATGKCSVLVTDSMSQCQRIKKKLEKHYFPNSCTFLKACFLTTPRFSETGAVTPYHQNTKKIIPLKEVLKKLHPSIVYTNSRFDVSCFTDSYCVKKITLSGSTNDLIGLGADPVNRWPGDYLI